MLCLPKAKKGARCFLDASDLPPDEDDPEERTAENYGVDGRHFHEERPASFYLNMLFFCCSVHFGCFLGAGLSYHCFHTADEDGKTSILTTMQSVFHAQQHLLTVAMYCTKCVNSSQSLIWAV